MSDSSNETGAPAEKRVRKTRAPKTPAADTAALAERVKAAPRAFWGRTSISAGIEQDLHELV